MSDAPLPEALTQMIGRADDIVARNMGAREPWCVELRNLFAEMVAFRGESDRQELWTREEVEPLIAVIRGFLDWGDSPDDDYSGLMSAARAALARVRSPEPAGATPFCSPGGPEKRVSE